LHPLYQVKCPQARSFKRLGNLQSNNGGGFQVAAFKFEEARRGLPAHGVQLTYKEARLEEEYPKRNA